MILPVNCRPGWSAMAFDTGVAGVRWAPPTRLSRRRSSGPDESPEAAYAGLGDEFTYASLVAFVVVPFPGTSEKYDGVWSSLTAPSATTAGVAVEAFLYAPSPKADRPGPTITGFGWSGGTLSGVPCSKAMVLTPRWLVAVRMRATRGRERDEKTGSHEQGHSRSAHGLLDRRIGSEIWESPRLLDVRWEERGRERDSGEEGYL